jgi:DNA topoisomerase IB
MARLRRSDWREPGITRRRRGSGFTYQDAKGAGVEPEARERINALAIPPAWTDVWVCADAHGHLQAVGVDDAGRRQYLYHEKWRLQRDARKYVKAQLLGRELPALRRRTARRLKTSGLTRERVLAASVRMLDLGLFRVGGERYANENASFGLATLKREHVTPTRDGVQFEFPAKSGQTSRFVISQPAVCRVITELLRRNDSSTELLGWWDGDSHEWNDIRSEHINEYVKLLASDEITAKDFRTWHGTVLMSMHLSDLVRSGDAVTGRRLASLYRLVADELGNTGTVARNAYVDPRVVELAEQAVVIEPFRQQRHELIPARASTAVLRLLEEDVS